MLQFIPIIGSLIKTAGGLFDNWQKRKIVKAEGKVKVEIAKVEGEVKRLNDMLAGDIEYDKIAADGMKYSWKDEFLTVLLAIPVIMCFIPYQPLQDQVAVGFSILSTTPEWYQYCFIGIIVASFGLKTWMKGKGLK
jgi:hypothetical protein